MNATEQKEYVRKTPFLLGRVVGALLVFTAGCLFVYFKLLVSVPDVEGENGYAALDEFELLRKDLEVRPWEKKKIRKKYGEFMEVESQSLPSGLTIRGALVTLEFKKLKAINVPKVVGESEEKAKEILDKVGFQVITEKRAALTEPEGVVIGQSPKGDETLAEGKEVKIYVSVGAKRRGVPAVTGLSVKKARTILENAGFNVRDVEADPPTDSKHETPGTVLRQIPGPDETKALGSVVKIMFVPVPPTPKEKLVRVPSVSDKSGPRAKRILKEAGFVVKAEREADPTTTKGYVIRTTPSGYVAPGTTVTIKVSLGRPRPPALVPIKPRALVPIKPPGKVPVQPEEIYYCEYCELDIPSGVRMCPVCGAAGTLKSP